MQFTSNNHSSDPAEDDFESSMIADFSDLLAKNDTGGQGDTEDTTQETETHESTTHHVAQIQNLAGVAGYTENRLSEHSDTDFGADSDNNSRKPEKVAAISVAHPVEGEAGGKIARVDFRGMVVPQRTIGDLCAWGPILAERDDFLHLACVLVTRRWTGESGRVVLSEQIVRQCFGDAISYRSGSGLHSSVKCYLESYRDAVDSAFCWTGYHSSGYARECKAHSIPDYIFDRYEQAMLDTDTEKQFAGSGKKVTARNVGKLRKEQRAAAASHAPLTEPPAGAKEWAKYLNSRSARTFSRLTNAFAEAHQAAGSLATPEATQQQRALLRSISVQPQPFYHHPDYTVRLAAPHSMQQLNADLRQILYPDERWVELDLSKAQLAIAATDWAGFDCVESGDLSVTRRYLRAHLSGEVDLWQELMQAAGVAGRAGKAMVKRGTYAIIYGAEGGLGFVMREAYAAQAGTYPHGGAVRGFIRHPMISELLDVRSRVLEQIRQGGGATDCYGRELRCSDLEGDHPERSVLAQVAQAREMWLMRPLLDAAQEEDDKARSAFQVVLYQYDGVTVRVRDKRRTDAVCKRLEAAVNQRAEAGGYLTRLERE